MRGLTLRLLGLEPAWPGLLRYPSAVPRLSTGNTPLVRPLRAPSRRQLRAAQPGRWCQWRLGGRRRVAAWTADADTDPNARGRSWAAGGQYRALEPDAGPAGFNVAAPRRSEYGAALRALIEMDFIKLGLTTKITRSLRGPPAQLQRGLTGLPLLICLALREGQGRVRGVPAKLWRRQPNNKVQCRSEQPSPWTTRYTSANSKAMKSSARRSQRTVRSPTRRERRDQD